MVVYMAPTATMDKMMKESTPEQQKAGMDSWRAWGEAHKADLAELGAPLGKNKRVTQDGAQDVRNEFTGYSIVNAASADDVAKIVADSPHLKMDGAYIEVMEVVDMSGK